MPFETLDEVSKKYIPLIDSKILEALKGSPEELYKASAHLIKAGGKRLRPLIVILTARALGGIEAEARAIPLAVAVEIFHNFTLVHDDIMDNDDFRRGIPTVHKVYGIPMAITAGDLMFAMSFLSMFDSLTSGLQEGFVAKSVKVLADAARKVAEGQAYDLLFERTWDVGPNDYLTMIYLKTSALIEASAKLGALASQAKDELVESMGEFGRLVGLAFQIRDDILGVFGDPAKTGKPVYGDLRRGKKTLLVMYAASRSEEARQLLSEVFAGSYDENKLKRTAELIKETGALDYAEGLANSYSQLAMERLVTLRKGGYVVDEAAYEALKELALFSSQREK
ncbi:MAG: polyprenyl synthetase family protein [Acidilobus sp.]